MKSVVIVSDMQCGNVYGLTPPSEFKASHHRKLQEETYDAYVAMTKRWAEPDILVHNGDAIDGRQLKQGGAELITPDRTVQCDMAYELLTLWKPKQVYMTYGSPYHVGQDAEDYERLIMQKFKDAKVPATIEGHLFLDVEGLIFDIRHKINTSIIPYGRATALLRELMWALVKEANATGPKVDVLIRSHAHYHVWTEIPGKGGLKYCCITPGLQLARGRFGSRECTGEIHWGAMRLIVDKGQIIRKDIDLCVLHANKPRVFKVK